MHEIQQDPGLECQWRKRGQVSGKQRRSTKFLITSSKEDKKRKRQAMVLSVSNQEEVSGAPIKDKYVRSHSVVLASGLLLGRSHKIIFFSVPASQALPPEQAVLELQLFQLYCTGTRDLNPERRSILELWIGNSQSWNHAFRSTLSGYTLHWM